MGSHLKMTTQKIDYPTVWLCGLPLLSYRYCVNGVASLKSWSSWYGVFLITDSPYFVEELSPEVLFLLVNATTLYIIPQLPIGPCVNYVYNGVEPPCNGPFIKSS